ncbi:hypothetical protein BGW42_001694 [Actinomortierella wolfii]|nr:hypothetical protein BGW42_001694 [Actinomortierella wolfii]
MSQLLSRIGTTSARSLSGRLSGRCTARTALTPTRAPMSGAMRAHLAFLIRTGTDQYRLSARAFSTSTSRPFFNWLFNPKEDPVEPKILEPLIMSETSPRLLFWDSTHSTPNLKPEFNDRAVSCLSTGIAHSCAIVDGNVHAWGSNYFSQVGLTTDSFHDDDSEEVTDVHFIHQLAQEDIVQIASGNYHNLALSKTGRVWSWGSGCLGRGDEMYDSLPQPVEFFHALGREVRQIFAAGNYSMAVARPKDSTAEDDELYVWGYIPFGELEGGDDDVTEKVTTIVANSNNNIKARVIPKMRKSLQPLLVTSLLGYKIHHVACSPWHFTVAVTPTNADFSPEYDGQEDKDCLEIKEVVEEKPILMTFGRFSEAMALEKPFSPMFMELPLEQEFLDIKPWRTFRSVSENSDLVIKKIVASKGNGSIGVSDHEDHVARLIHRPLDDHIIEVAGGSSEVIAISDEGRVMAWKTPREDNHAASSHSSSSTSASAAHKTTSTRVHHGSSAPEHHRTSDDQADGFVHPLDDYANKDKAHAKKEILDFFDSQRIHRQQLRPKRLVEALFEPPSIIIHKPGLSKCSAHYDRFTIC